VLTEKKIGDNAENNTAVVSAGSNKRSSGVCALQVPECVLWPRVADDDTTCYNRLRDMPSVIVMGRNGRVPASVGRSFPHLTRSHAFARF